MLGLVVVISAHGHGMTGQTAKARAGGQVAKLNLEQELESGEEVEKKVAKQPEEKVEGEKKSPEVTE